MAKITGLTKKKGISKVAIDIGTEACFTKAPKARLCATLSGRKEPTAK